MNDPPINDQIQILATNIEVLNQKLLRNPEAGASPAEAALKKEAAKLDLAVSMFKENTKRYDDQIKGLQNVAQSMDNSLSKEIRSLKSSVELITEQSTQAGKFNEQVHEMKSLIRSLETINRNWLESLMNRLDFFNRTLGQLNTVILHTNKNLSQYSQELKNTVQSELNNFNAKILNSFSKNLLYYILAIIFLSVLFSGAVNLIFKAFGS